jgi:uncharacterized protein (TIGR02594 family)
MRTLDIQKRLKDLGFEPGPLDGTPGRQTSAAVRAFQRSKKLEEDGIVGPATLAALFADKPTETMVESNLPWLDIARRKKGLHEGKNHAELSTFLRSDGKTLGDPAKNPWCGDFVETCIAVTLQNEPLPANPYLARNWLKFGKPIEPTMGAVAVYWRGKKQGSQGHVAFLVGEGNSANGPVFYNLGGNQSNAVTVTPIAKNRLLGCRWPASAATGPIHLAKMTGGRLSVDEA